MSRLVFTIILLNFLLPFGSLKATNTQLEITDDFIFSDLGPYMTYSIDSSKSLSFNDIIKLPPSNWLKFKNDRASLPPEIGHHWIKVNLNMLSSNNQKFILNLAYAHLAKYQVYFVTQDNLNITTFQGDNYLFKDRYIKHPTFLHDLKLDGEQNAELYFLIDQFGQVMPLPIQLWNQAHFYRFDTNKRFFHGLMLGMIFLIAILLFFIFRVTKLEFLIYEIGVLIFSILYVLAEEGYGMMYLWGDHPSLNGYSRPLSIGVVSILNIIVSFKFLNLESKTLKEIGKSLIITYLTYLFLFHPINILGFNKEPIVSDFIFIFLVLTFLLTLFNIYLACYSFVKKKNYDALVLILVYFFIAINLLGQSLIHLFELPLNIISQHGGLLVITTHCIFIGGFMIYKGLATINQNKKIIYKLAEEKRIAAESILDNLNIERERISMDIHDSLGSLISATYMNLQSLKEKHPKIAEEPTFKKSIEHTHKIASEMRTISHNLMPKTLRSFGLLEEIQRLIDDLKVGAPIKFNFEYSGFKERLPEKIELEVYRIIFESLDNILKYSKATEVLIQLNKFENEINVIVEDDGIGFNIDNIRSGANGLDNLKNRIKLLNGELDIYSEPNEGTSINFNIPYS